MTGLVAPWSAGIGANALLTRGDFDARLVAEWLAARDLTSGTSTARIHLGAVGLRAGWAFVNERKWRMAIGGAARVGAFVASGAGLDQASTQARLHLMVSLEPELALLLGARTELFVAPAVGIPLRRYAFVAEQGPTFFRTDPVVVAIALGARFEP
jgi:hypothetical protein